MGGGGVRVRLCEMLKETESFSYLNETYLTDNNITTITLLNLSFTSLTLN